MVLTQRPPTCVALGVCIYLIRVEIFPWWGNDLSHEGGVLDVFLVAEHVHGVLSRLCGPVANITRAIALIVALNLGLGWTLHRET